MSYFTKEPTANFKLGGKEIGPSKRHLYQQIHEVPVFNLRVSNQPILVSFRFTVFRMANKKKIFVQAKMLQTSMSKLVLMYVSLDAPLSLELTEKQA